MTRHNLPKAETIALPTLHALDLASLPRHTRARIADYLHEHAFTLDPVTQRYYLHGTRKFCLDHRDRLNQLMEESGFQGEHFTS